MNLNDVLMGEKWIKINFILVFRGVSNLKKKNFCLGPCQNERKIEFNGSLFIFDLISCEIRMSRVCDWHDYN